MIGKVMIKDIPQAYEGVLHGSAPCGVTYPFTPQSERCQELFARWAVAVFQDKPNGKPRRPCPHCGKKQVPRDRALWLCEECVLSLRSYDFLEPLKEGQVGCKEEFPPTDDTSAQWEMAIDVARSFTGDFSLSEFIIACWKRFPKAFGLEGYYPSHPDSNKVIALLSHKNGPVARGGILKVGEKRYRAAGR